MTTRQLAWNAATYTVTAQADGDDLPAGSVKLPDYHHDDSQDLLGPTVNHVLFHHVRDALYPLGVYDMQRVKILIDGDFIALVSISSTPATVTLAAAATEQITTTFTPTTASNKKLTYVSDDPTKATVSATGLITAVATGSATITVTSDDGGKTDTVVVTIS